MLTSLRTFGTTVGTTAEDEPNAYAYPPDLARFAIERWGDQTSEAEALQRRRNETPDARVLERLLSTCYQASLLRDEERPVAFRAILATPEDLPEDGGPPEGLHRMEFDAPRPFDERELRRLSPAADFERSLVGVRLGEDGEMEIWGLVHSGPRWLRIVRGGRQSSAPPPPVPVVKVEGPGHLAVKRGSEFVAALAGGRLSDSHPDVFSSRWLARVFAPVEEDLLRRHGEARLEAEARGEAWAPLDPEFPRMIARQMYRRLISTLSEARHGGTVITVPQGKTAEILAGTHISLGHAFADAEPRRRLGSLIVGTMNRLARAHGRYRRDPQSTPVGWEEYVGSEDGELADLDEAIFEFAHLVAGYAAIDGAVVMTHHCELLGFGGEISGDLEPVRSVDRALDPEGELTVREGVENVGTRHRSAYRLARAMPDAVSVVVSQDGNARFVADRTNAVTCWDQP